MTVSFKFPKIFLSENFPLYGTLKSYNDDYILVLLDKTGTNSTTLIMINQMRSCGELYKPYDVLCLQII